MKPVPKFTTYSEAWELFYERMPNKETWSPSKVVATRGLFLAGYSAGVTAAATILLDAIKEGKTQIEDDLQALEEDLTKNLPNN